MLIWTLLISIGVVAVITAVSYLAAGRRPTSDAERSSSWIKTPPDGGSGL